MPSTKRLIDILKMNAQSWDRTGDKSLIQILEDAQNLLLLQENEQSMVFGSDGYLPKFSTSDSIYEYTMNQATTGLSVDVWRVAQVLVRAPFANTLRQALQVEYNLQPNLRQPHQLMEYNGIEYYRFYQIHTEDAIRGIHPKVRFTLNPGDTTDVYHILAYKKPAELLSEGIETQIPEQHHLTILIPTALKLLEAHQNGNWIEALAFIKENYQKQFQAEMNEGEQGLTYTITRNEE